MCTLHLFSAKIREMTEQHEEQRNNLYSLPDTYMVTNQGGSDRWDIKYECERCKIRPKFFIE
jgi:hypothetical protein